MASSVVTLGQPSAASQDENANVNSLGQLLGAGNAVEEVSTTFSFSRHGRSVTGLFLPLTMLAIAAPIPQIPFYGVNADGSVNTAVTAIIPTSMRPLANTEVRVRVKDVTQGTTGDGYLHFNTDGTVVLEIVNSAALNLQLGDTVTIQNVPISWITSLRV
jgi:hypothetical protein